MPVKAGVVRAAERTTKAGRRRDLYRNRVSGPGHHRELAVAAGRLGRHLHAGARTAWHAHPVGQTLYCLTGVGRICFEGEPPQVLNPGDTVNIPPNTQHWHGASPDRLFAHLALSEAGEKGEGTAWGGHVSDEEYGQPATGG